ncbi:hypothetical protein J3A64_004780 [Pseudarthrobacter sp. PvP004]|nr:hypothetical protein [Pseudarthrobacter sp. PvP004]
MLRGITWSGFDKPIAMPGFYARGAWEQAFVRAIYGSIRKLCLRPILRPDHGAVVVRPLDDTR